MPENPKDQLGPSPLPSEGPPEGRPRQRSDRSRPADKIKVSHDSAPDGQEAMPDRCHPYRLPDDVYVGDERPVLVTVRVKDGSPLLSGRAADAAIKVLLARAENAGIAVHACCAMLTHLHFVATVSGGAPLPSFMRSFKSGAAHAINRLGTLSERFSWQRSYYDTYADGDFGAHEQIKYVLGNPVEAGLCERWEDWPHTVLLSWPES